MNIEVLKIDGAKTLPLRKNILKPFATLPDCAYPEDNFESTFHFGLYLSKNLIGVATFIQENNPNLYMASKLSYRLRGMAIAKDFQGQGYGQVLLNFGLEYLRNQKCDLVWFNARITAFSFYERLNFKHHGELFELPKIGPHKVMYKNMITG